MNCQKCNFYCYDDEYICPNCEAILEKELPIDKNGRSTNEFSRALPMDDLLGKM